MSAAMCGSLLWPAVGAIGQESDQPRKTVRKPVKIRSVVTGKNWLGIRPVAIDEALKAQLNLKDRLIVHHVAPGSPAEKAGVQQHDILLKFGDTEITDLEGLMAAVDQHGTKSASVVLMRGGKEMTFTITPEERPAEEDVLKLVPWLQSEEAKRLLSDKLKLLGPDSDGAFTWRVLGPGVAPQVRLWDLQHGEFPSGWSISVTKEDDKQAKITARKDGKSYETTDDRLDVLPEDIRPFVERMLMGGKGLTFKLDKTIDPKGKVEIGVKKALEELQNAESPAGKFLRQQLEVRKADDSAIRELKKELESLRKDVEKLKKSDE
jgi:hypothetical protein